MPAKKAATKKAATKKAATKKASVKKAAPKVDPVPEEIEEPEVKESEVKENKKPISEIAQEVLQGKWGSVDDRRLRLSKAGYDHNEVQREVVRLRNP
jgi:hypothetical protein